MTPTVTCGEPRKRRSMRVVNYRSHKCALGPHAESLGETAAQALRAPAFLAPSGGGETSALVVPGCN